LERGVPEGDASFFSLFDPGKKRQSAALRDCSLDGISAFGQTLRHRKGVFRSAAFVRPPGPPLFVGADRMAKISKPDANPMVAVLLCLVLQLGHFLINGQQKKWLMILVVQIISCCFGPIWLVLGMIEAYKTAQKLKAGKEVDENEYSFKIVYTICKFIHKDAVLVE
jgi:hypothetical protein